MISKSTSLGVVALLCSSLGLAFAAEEGPAIEGGVLTIPSVDTPAAVAAFQDVVFDYSAQRGWTLRAFLILGESGLASARVESVELVQSDSFPVQVFLRASGPDRVGCAAEDRVTHRLDGNHFTVQFSQSYDTSGEIVCTADLRPFRKTIALPVYGLAAGSYTYSLNGFTGSFELTADNGLAGDFD